MEKILLDGYKDKFFKCNARIKFLYADTLNGVVGKAFYEVKQEMNNMPNFHREIKRFPLKSVEEDAVLLG